MTNRRSVTSKKNKEKVSSSSIIKKRKIPFKRSDSIKSKSKDAILRNDFIVAFLAVKKEKNLSGLSSKSSTSSHEKYQELKSANSVDKVKKECNIVDTKKVYTKQNSRTSKSINLNFDRNFTDAFQAVLREKNSISDPQLSHDSRKSSSTPKEKIKKRKRINNHERHGSSLQKGMFLKLKFTYV